MSASEIREAWTFPVSSQEFEQGPRLELVGENLQLLYDFYSQNGDIAWETITFLKVAAYSLTIFEHCSAEQLEAYDRIVEVIDSEWLGSLSRLDDDVKHFRIFFDEFGCYEIAASSFVPPPETSRGA